MKLKYIDFHLHTTTQNDELLEIQNIYLQEFAKRNDLRNSLYTCGLHPWHLDSLSLKECHNLLSGVAHLPGLLAIGECGLDKNTEFSIDLQTEYLRLHILVAKQYHKPLLIHCVRRHGELLQLLKQEKFRETTVIHGFDSKLSVAEQLLDHGILFSFGSAILKENHPAAAVLAALPDDHFFLETDDSGIPIADIYQKAAHLRNTSEEFILNVVQNNLHNLMHKQ